MDLSQFDSLPALFARQLKSSDDEFNLEFAQGCQNLALFLFSVLRKARFSSHDAEVLAQEALGDIVLKIDKFSDMGKGSFAAWCRQIAMNRGRNWIRDSDSDKSLLVDPSSFEFIPIDLSPSEAQESVTQDSDAAWKLLSTLGERAYEITLLRVVDELSFDEIAERLKMSVDNVRQIYHRSRKKLADL